MPEATHFISITPFLGLLMLIAAMPLVNARLWGNNFVKLGASVFLSIPVIIYLSRSGHARLISDHLLFDYIPFIVLLGSLFIISGGIYVSAQVSGKPHVNLIFLVTGATLASLIGTTGASMLLIRPLIRSNKDRKYKVHIIAFFIAIVANTGGLLTPLGDPALFILYLHGVPFEWFLTLWPQWLFINGLLAGMFYLVDRYYFTKQYKLKKPVSRYSGFHFRLHGSTNFLWMSGVVVAIALINEKNLPLIKTYPYLIYSRELIILLMAGMSLITSNKRNLKRNAFSWGPVLEIAALFLGIFITMIPALLFMEQNTGKIGINSPVSFYFSTGFLSSILDNTPTAAVFHSLAKNITTQSSLPLSEITNGVQTVLVKAISLGAVAFGSLTYIGNGPNFMVKSIAESNGLKMPGFIGYVLRYSIVFFLPAYCIVYLIFL